MYTCWMALLKWELAEVALVEDVLRGERAAGRAGRESEVRKGGEERKLEMQLLSLIHI